MQTLSESGFIQEFKHILEQFTQTKKLSENHEFIVGDLIFRVHLEREKTLAHSYFDLTPAYISHEITICPLDERIHAIVKQAFHYIHPESKTRYQAYMPNHQFDLQYYTLETFKEYFEQDVPKKHKRCTLF